MAKTITLRLTIEVNYETNGVETSKLESLLTEAADHLAGEGLFSGDTDAEVTSWHPHVDAIHSSGPTKA